MAGVDREEGGRGEGAEAEVVAASLGALSLGGDGGGDENAASPEKKKPPPPPSSPPLVAMDPVLRALDEAISWPSRHGAAAAALGLRWPAGLLVHGPPGTGKTSAVRAAAEAAGAPVVVVSAGSLFGSALGESEARLRGAFRRAERAAARERRKAVKSGSSSSYRCGRAVLLLDDVDLIAPARSAAGPHEARVVAQLLTLLDGAGTSGGRRRSRRDGDGGDAPPSPPPVVVVATTSKPGSLDPALRRAGRLDREVSTRLPDAREREEILRSSAAASLPLADDVDLGAVAAEARGYSGADLAALAREAARGAMRASLEDEGRDRERRLVTAGDFAAALSLVGASVSRGAVSSLSSTDLPNRVTWEDVGGIDDAKRALRRAVELPLSRPEACARLGVPAARGVLLYGPPGCSKTTLARALANAAGATLHTLSAASLFSAFVGEGEAALRAAFAAARAAPPSIVFLDEADAVGGAGRGGGEGSPADSSSARMLAALLAEVDGLESGSGRSGGEADGEGASDGKTPPPPPVLLLAATNRPWALDAALLRPGRLDCHVLVPPPDARGRGEALKVHCRRIPLAEDVDLSEIGARLTPERTTGAELAAVAREAALAAAREGLDRVSRRHFERAVAAVGGASVSEREMERYEAWGRGEF